jgi:dipeptidyl aminopeptidase/acylaminoacyl peptidase
MRRSTPSRVLATLTGAVIVDAMLVGAATRGGLQSSDLYKLRSIGDVRLAPDGRRIAYLVQQADRPGAPYSQLWITDASSGRAIRLGDEMGGASTPAWSPDGRQIAYVGREEQRPMLTIAGADGSAPTPLAEITGTNHPVPAAGNRVAWSPDGKQIAFISAAPGPEIDANGDPMVITRYLYKPTASEGLTRFNDNRRLHIFVVDVATKRIRQLTRGNYYEHSIDWSPAGDEIAFVSNHEADPDRFFNYDLFAVRVADGSIRPLTETKSAEYQPKWSPDGTMLAYTATKRPLTSSETTMEDTHVWVMNADGSGRRELGGGIDNRQGAPQWTRDGKSVCFTVQERGNVRLVRLSLDGGAPRALVHNRGSVGAWSIGRDDAVAYTFSTPSAPADLYLSRAADVGSAPRRLTDENRDVLAGKAIADVEALTYKSFDGMAIEAFLTKPLGLRPDSKHPMIVMIHGGPHGQQGPSFNSKAQVYADQGWATLMVNYRGSTGYGQRLADAIFKDQNGGDAKDVLAGVDAALARYSWIDRDRLGIEGGSYGGQLTNWIITQTDRFKAAIPTAGIANLVSFNYMAYYHDYLAVEFGSFPHESGLIDRLWERSPIRYAKNAKTPTLFIHGENDNDVPIAEAEQYYIALRDVGVDTAMVRYPREGHGVRETRHVVDAIDRSIAWYARYFGRPAGSAPLSR